MLIMTMRSDNTIPIIHRLVTDEYGENYWFNGCAKYVMECLGEPDYDYWFFAGITGDIFTQHYAYDKSTWDAIDGYLFTENPKQYIKDIFAKCGYSATYINRQEIKENTETYLNMLITYVDKGIPVISWDAPCGVIVGYEDNGRTLLYITGNSDQPKRMRLDEALSGQAGGWIFVGEKNESPQLTQLYRDAICAIPQLFSVKTDAYCFGPEAFRAWARDIGRGKFDGMTTEEFDVWYHYTNYVCILATNGSCCYSFLNKVQELNPDFTWLDQIKDIYRRTGEIWNEMEALGGGFNITLDVLQDNEKRGVIAAKILEAADCADEVLRVLGENFG